MSRLLFLVSATIVLAVPIQSDAHISAKPPLFRVLANDYSFAAPAQPPSGIVTVRLVNLGRETHMLVLSPVPDSLTLRRFYELATGNQPSPLIRGMGGPNLTRPGDSSEVTLPFAPGRYILTCWVNAPDGKPHIMHGMMSEIRVVRGSATLPPPRASVVIRASDYAFELRGQLHAGDNTVAFENSGPQEHDIQFVQLGAGETVAMIREWAERGSIGSPTQAVVGGTTGITGMEKGWRNWFTLHLSPGRYAVFCWVPDVKDGKAHLLHGMLREVTVS